MSSWRIDDSSISAPAEILEDSTWNCALKMQKAVKSFRLAGLYYSHRLSSGQKVPVSCRCHFVLGFGIDCIDNHL